VSKEQMRESLNNNRLEYVLFHLGNHMTISPEIKASFCFSEGKDSSGFREKIVFLLSSDELNPGKVPSHLGIPVLFPVLKTDKIFDEDENGNLIFCHDLLKSIFYLLSGYQEYSNPKSSDNLRRFSFQDSVQYKLGFIEKPIVNYYFDFIADGIERYCQKRNILFQRKRLFPNYGFLLSHDIDKVDTYDFNYVVYKFKELVGLRKNKLSFKKKFGLFFKGMLQFTNLQKKTNPYWNFDFLRQVERERGFKSTFYFLDQGIRHSDAYYSFDEERMIKLFQFLQDEGCEIGLHGTVDSISNESKMSASLQKLERTSKTKVAGARQHRLLWKHPSTAAIQIKCGLQYDTTLGFAAHEGFRNSYCLPFKLYDFENEKTLTIWELPLNAMDVTLFAYQKYSTEIARHRCRELIDEIKKFGGVFNLLFHNSAFDEVTFPGITKFYLDLLDHVFNAHAENILAKDLIIKVEGINKNNPLN